MIDNLILGLNTVLVWQNLLYCFFGVFIGNLIGVLPGIGPLAALSMLLPMTYGLGPVPSLMMLAGLYYGTSYGGAITAILLNIPGTAQHAVVCVDGHPMAKQGKAGSAIFMGIFASFVGACFGVVILSLFSPVIARVALQFGAPEYFALMLLGLLAASGLTTGSPIKGIIAVVFGLVFGFVGADMFNGKLRLTLGLVELQDGISLVALALGLFGVMDILLNVGKLDNSNLIGQKNTTEEKKSFVRPDPGDMTKSFHPIIRGGVIGSFFGALPGTGGTFASFMSYTAEKKLSKTPERFGRGAIEGVAGPESANSSADITAFIPTLTLGIPGDAVMALMLGALMIHNIIPGPRMMSLQPDLFWGLIMSFWVGNLFLLILNIPLVNIWVKLLAVPYRILYPIILVLICVGAYSSSYTMFDVLVVLVIGIFGYIITKLGFEPAPLLMGFVLGPMVEENFRRSLNLSDGDLSIFITRPISGVCLAICLLMLCITLYKQLKTAKRVLK